MWGKHSPFDRALRSTLIVRVPGVSTPGAAIDGLVETLDIYPTLLELCRPSVQLTKPLDGRSLVPLLTGEASSIRDAAVSYWGSAVTVRTSDYRLIVSGSDDDRAVELYRIDRSSDPLANVALDHPDVVERLLELAR